jgi:hypothetical protein
MSGDEEDGKPGGDAGCGETDDEGAVGAVEVRDLFLGGQVLGGEGVAGEELELADEIFGGRGGESRLVFALYGGGDGDVDAPEGGEGGGVGDRELEAREVVDVGGGGIVGIGGVNDGSPDGVMELEDEVGLGDVVDDLVVAPVFEVVEDEAVGVVGRGGEARVLGSFGEVEGVGGEQALACDGLGGWAAALGLRRARDSDAGWGRATVVLSAAARPGARRVCATESRRARTGRGGERRKEPLRCSEGSYVSRVARDLASGLAASGCACQPDGCKR